MRFALPAKRAVSRWTLGVLGAIFVGAVGNGVWQSILEPSLHTITRWVLNIASLGLASYRVGIYQQIAADDQSRIAIATLGHAIMIHSMIFVAAMFYLFYLVNRVRREGDRLLRRLSDAADPVAHIPPDKIRRDAVAALKTVGIARIAAYCLVAFAVFLIGDDLVSLAKRSYVSSADAHFHQVLRVDLPNLDARAQAEAESEFAQIGSREDYVRLLSKLESQCKAHGQSVPEFNPW